jgi:hypothetical protein
VRLSSGANCKRTPGAHPPRVNKSQTKVSAGSSIWSSNQSRGILIRSFQMTYLHADCKAWRPAMPLQQTRTTFGNKEMRHAEIHRCPRVDLADRHPGAHPDCKCSPCVPCELRVRGQRLLTASRASERFCSRLNSQDGRLALARRPSCDYTIAGPWKCRNDQAMLHYRTATADLGDLDIRPLLRQWQEDFKDRTTRLGRSGR